MSVTLFITRYLEYILYIYINIFVCFVDRVFIAGCLCCLFVVRGGGIDVRFL